MCQHWHYNISTSSDQGKAKGSIFCKKHVVARLHQTTTKYKGLKRGFCCNNKHQDHDGNGKHEQTKRLKTRSRCRGCNNKVTLGLEGINTNQLGDDEHNQEKMNINKPKENKHEQSKGKQT